MTAKTKIRESIINDPLSLLPWRSGFEKVLSSLEWSEPSDETAKTA